MVRVLLTKCARTKAKVIYRLVILQICIFAYMICYGGLPFNNKFQHLPHYEDPVDNPIVNFFGHSIYVVTLPKQFPRMRQATRLLGIYRHTNFVEAFNINPMLNKTEPKNHTLKKAQSDRLVEQGLIRSIPEISAIEDAKMIARGFKPKKGKIYWKEIACFISHSLAYKRAINDHLTQNRSKSAPILFMEDDIYMRHRWVNPTLTKFNKFIAELDRLTQNNGVMNDWEFINFGRCSAPCETDLEFNMVEGSQYFIDLKNTSSDCAHTYAIRNLSVAQRLYERFLPISIQYMDDFYTSAINNGSLRGYATYPALLRQGNKKHGDCQPWATLMNDTATSVSTIDDYKNNEKKLYERVAFFRKYLRLCCVEGKNNLQSNIMIIERDNLMHTYYTNHEMFDTNQKFGNGSNKTMVSIQYNTNEVCQNSLAPFSKIQRHIAVNDTIFYCVNNESKFLDRQYIEGILRQDLNASVKMIFIYTDIYTIDQLRMFADLAVHLANESNWTDNIITGYKHNWISFPWPASKHEMLKEFHRNSVELKRYYTLEATVPGLFRFRPLLPPVWWRNLEMERRQQSQEVHEVHFWYYVLPVLFGILFVIGFYKYLWTYFCKLQLQMSHRGRRF